MTFRQILLKLFYPILMLMPSGKFRRVQHNPPVPPVDFHALQMMLLDGRFINFEQFAGKKVLLVNIASDCGYTAQLSSLEKLYQSKKDKLYILAFPSNDFKEQEKGTNEEIAQFCQKNYGLSFPVMQKSVVIRAAEQNPVYQWLSDPGLNGWNKQPPVWNFSKYLVDEQGRLIALLGPGVDPLDEQLLELIC